MGTEEDGRTATPGETRAAHLREVQHALDEVGHSLVDIAARLVEFAAKVEAMRREHETKTGGRGGSR
jgi:hypothetical protein